MCDERNSNPFHSCSSTNTIITIPLILYKGIQQWCYHAVFRTIRHSIQFQAYLATCNLYLLQPDMSLRLKINDKVDDKLSENFPNDPYADITILLESNTLQLSLAYLAIESRYFADLPEGTSTVDLSCFNQDYVLAVLRALYGGPLQCTGISDLQKLLAVIDFLKIEEYRQTIERELQVWFQKKQGVLGLIEWIQFCLKNNILKKWLTEWLCSQNLKCLESTKNYLQLGKLSDQSVNYILLECLKRRNDCDSAINVIMENYFNRKGHNPNQYLQRKELFELKKIWEKNHHRFQTNKLDKSRNSMQQLISTMTVPLPISEKEINKMEKPVFKTFKTLNDFNCASVDLAGEIFKSEKVTDQYQLDMRVSVLESEVEQKKKKIDKLREELKQLHEQAAKRKMQDEQSRFDIALLKSRMRSKRDRISQKDTSANEYAFDNACKRVESDREQKIKLVSKIPAAKKYSNN